jgi:aryl-alcohol dehydrogenase-like predicted oxidoreductase
VGLIAKVPLDSGWLSGKYRSDSLFQGVRNRWTKETVARRAALVERFSGLVPNGLSLTQAALHFVLSHPEISTAIPGSKSVGQVLENMSASGAVMPPETLTAIRELWQQELRTNPLPW